MNETTHKQTDNCGFDRNGSHNAGHYVCTCGWEDERRVRRPTEERRKALAKKAAEPRLQLIKELRMQARTRAAANRMMKVEPSEPELFLEWKAADLLEST